MGIFQRIRWKVCPREELDCLLPETWGHYKVATPFKQVQGLYICGSLSLVYPGCIFFCSTLYWHSSSKIGYMSHFLWFYMLFKEPIKCLYLSCTKIMVVVGDTNSSLLFFWWYRFLGVATCCAAGSSLWFPRGVSQGGDRPKPKFARLTDWYPENKSSVSTSYSGFRFHFSKFGQAVFHYLFSSSMLYYSWKVYTYLVY